MLVAPAPQESGREALLRFGREQWGGEPTFLPSRELKTLTEVAAWKTPSGWRVLSFGLSAQDLALYTYELSGRGFELTCEVEGDELPEWIAAALDDVAKRANWADATGKPRKCGKQRVVRSTMTGLDTANGRVEFLEVIPAKGGAFTTSLDDAPVAERLKAWARQRSRLAVGITVLADDGESRSHVGGTARVPANFEWPKHDRMPTALLLQLDLSEVPADPLLPSEGSLLLFGPPFDGSSDAFTLEWVPTAEVERTEGQLLERADLRFTVFDDIPPERELVAASVLKGMSQGERESLAMSLREELPSVRHQLLGCVHPIQDSPVVEALCAMRGLRPPLPKKDWAALEQEAEGWVVVLQLADTYSFSFAGNGALFVVCTKDDLAARRFENCQFVIQR